MNGGFGSLHVVIIGAMSSSPDAHGQISPDEPVVLPLRELTAALTVLAAVDRLLLHPTVGPELLVGLTARSLGLAGRDHELTETASFRAVPRVTDRDSARHYLQELRARLKAHMPNGGLDLGYEPVT